MQYGSLTDPQIQKFKDIQGYTVRRPTYVVWIEGYQTQDGIADPTQYIMEIDVEVALESPLGPGYINMGRAILVANNQNRSFYSQGESRIKKNAKIKIWAGFDNLNIPIFSGIIHNVSPKRSMDTVTLNCKDYMGLFQEILIKGSQEPDNTAKSLIENFCNIVNIPKPYIPSTEETTREYSHPWFEEQTLLAALEETCNSIFYVAYIDENGRLKAHEREYSEQVDYLYTDNNIIDSENLMETEIINHVTIEYDEGFQTQCADQTSIDAYGESSRSYSIFLINSTTISEKVTGTTSEILENELEAFRFTTSEYATLIDSLHIKMRQNGAYGNITVKICTEDNGFPGETLTTSQLKASANLSEEFTWEDYYFATPIQISPFSHYWAVIDTSSLSSGEVYVQIDKDGTLSGYAYWDGIWKVEDNKQVLHKIRGSKQCHRLAEDIVRFHRLPQERMKIIAPAVPQLQIMDEVLVEIKEIYGHYVIEGRRHIMSSGKYITLDTLRKVS